MSKHKPISHLKRVRIASNNIKSERFEGKYFRIRSAKAYENIPVLRANLLPDYYKAFIDEMVKSPDWTTMLLNGKSKRTVRDLDSLRLLKTEANSELLWARYIISVNTKYISEFIRYSNSYSNALMCGEYESAGNYLDTIERQFGSSLWLIKTRTAFLQLTLGLEPQKKFNQKIRSQLRDRSLIKFIVYWNSVANEPQTSLGRLKGELEPILDQLDPDLQPGYKEFAGYHLLNILPADLDGYAHILRQSYSTSIIDYYEAFILALQHMVVSKNSIDLIKVFSALAHFKNKIADDRMDLMCALLGMDFQEDKLKSAGNHAYELYLQGNYEEAFAQADKALDIDPCNVMGILVKSYSCAILGSDALDPAVYDKEADDYINGSLRDLMIDGISKVFNKGVKGVNDIYNTLSKIALNFSNFSWISAITISINQENQFPRRIEAGQKMLLSDSKLNPVLIDYQLDLDMAGRYRALCDLIYPSSLSVGYHSFLLEPSEHFGLGGLSSMQADLLSARKYFEASNFGAAILHAGPLCHSHSGYFERRAYGIISHAHLECNDLIQATKTAADCFVHNRSYYPFLPLKELAAQIKPGTACWKSVNSLIELPIIFDACVRNLDSSFETARRFAYEDYLTKNGVSKPSELARDIGPNSKEKFIYYLRFICVESTMDMSDAFEGGTEEVLAERLYVCRWLVEIDPDNEEEYKQEINGLVRRQVILSRRQEIDQSRVYVDIESVKEWAQGELAETYGRYQAYLRHGVNSISQNSKNIEKFKLEIPDTKDASKINVPVNEVFALLSYMIETIGKSYLSSDVGLDRFISTRIRHGELERTMRIPLQKHNLITKKQAKDGPYMKNKFWLDKFKGYSQQIVQELDRSFTEFSSAYDGLISEIANNWLQITKPSKPNGLFDFVLFEFDYERIYDTTNKDTSLKQFVNNVISLFEQKLIYVLLEIRQKLNKVARKEAKTLLNNLQEAALTGEYGPFLELQGAISQGRTDLQAQFDKIIEWFIPSSAGSSTPYQLEDAIWVAEASIKEENPLFEIDIDAEELEFSIHGQIARFVDVFINIFENVVKRSGLEIPKAYIKIWAVEESDQCIMVYCKVVNDLGVEIDANTLSTDLKKKQAILDTGEFVEFLAKDKSSGLFKIYTNIRDMYNADFTQRPSVDFGVDGNQFQITLSVPFRIYKFEPVEQI